MSGRLLDLARRAREEEAHRRCLTCHPELAGGVLDPARPCIECEDTETEPEDLFCPACWEKRLARMPLDVAERRRRLDRARREKRAGLLATSPHAGRPPTSPARSTPETSPDGGAA